MSFFKILLALGLMSGVSQASTYVCEIEAMTAPKFPEVYIEVNFDAPFLKEVVNYRLSDGRISQIVNLHMTPQRVNRIQNLSISDSRCEVLKTEGDVLETNWVCGDIKEFGYAKAEGFLKLDKKTWRGQFVRKNWHLSEPAHMAQSYSLKNCSMQSHY